jgi:orotate phosphoribosyltransferase
MHPLLALTSVRHGHFQMESGHHSETWFELGGLFAQPARLQPFVAELAQRLARHQPEVVCGPLAGGARVADLIGKELGLPSLTLRRFEATAREPGLFAVQYRLSLLERARVARKRVVLVDDAISAGSAVRGSHEEMGRCGAKVVAVGALILFGHGILSFASEHALALESVIETDFALWPPDSCPLCQRGVPLEKVSDAVT